MIRYFADHITTHTNQEYRVEIDDSEFSGTAEQIKGTGSDWLSFSYQKLDPRAPFGDPIQKGVLDFSVWIEDAGHQALIDDILAAPETQFSVKLFIDSQLEWQGFIIGDLTTYTEAETPKATLSARDFTVLKGIDYDFVELPTLTRLSEIIAECLRETGLSLPIRSYTNLINTQVPDYSEDFLYSLFHQKFALRNQDTPLSCFEVLETICRAYNLIIKQAGGRWVIDQLPAIAKGDAVRYDYDADGFNPTATQTYDRSITPLAITQDSTNEVAPALKSLTSTYKHRTFIADFDTPDVTNENSFDIVTKTLPFDREGQSYFYLDISATVETQSGFGVDGSANIELIAVSESSRNYYDQSGGGFTSTQKDTEIGLSDNNGTLEGNLIISDAAIPDGVEKIEIVYKWAEASSSGQSETVTEVSFSDITAYIFKSTPRDWKASIRNRYTRTGRYSADEQIDPTLLGDGPTSGKNFASRGRPAIANFVGNVVEPGRFRIRGDSDSLLLQELILREGMSMRRDSLRMLDADMIGAASIENTISYDGHTWYILGFEVDGFTGRINGNILRLDYRREAGDTFEQIIEEGGGGLAGSSAGGANSGGDSSITDHGALSGLEDDDHPQYLTEGRGDARYPRLDADNQWTGQNTFTQQAIFADGVNLPNASPIQSGGNNALEFDAMGNVTVPGNLEVLGETLSANVENLDVDDPIIKLADGNTTDALDIGFVGQRGSGNVGFIWDESADEFAAVATDSDAETGNVNVNGYLDVHVRDLQGRDGVLRSLLLEQGATIDDQDGYFTSQTFAGGFGGNGTRVDQQGGDWNATYDNLVVRRSARFYELIVEKVRANGGTIVISPGAEKITGTQQTGAAFDWNGDYNPFAPGATNAEGVPYTWTDQYECFIEEDKYITIDTSDLVWRQQWTGRGTGVTEGGVIATETGSATETVNDPPRSFTMWIPADSEAPQAGHDFAVIGNTTDPARQNGIIITASDTGNPYRRIYAGVDSLEKFGAQETIKGQDGRLDNLVVPYFDDLDGSQQNLYGAYWDGNFYVNDGHFRGVVTITDPDASNAATKGYVDQQSGSSVTTIISDSPPTQRSGGGALQVGDSWLDSSDGLRPYSWDGSQWVREYTIIDGGDLETGSITANKLTIGSVKDLDSDAAVIGDIITDYGDLNGKPSLGNVAALDSITSTYIGNGAVVTAKLAAGAVVADKLNVNSLEAVSASTGALTIEADGEITNTARDYILDEDGYRMRADQGDVNKFRWINGPLGGSNENADLIFDVYAYHRSVDNTNRAVLRAQGVSPTDSEIFLTATRTVLNSEARFGEPAVFESFMQGEYQQKNYTGSGTIGIDNISKPVVYIQHDDGQVTIDEIDGGDQRFLLLVNESNQHDLFLEDKSGAPGGNIKVQSSGGAGGTIRFRPNAAIWLHNKGGTWRHVANEGG